MAIDMYDMKVNTKITDNHCEITRVPGGWIYRFWHSEEQDFISAPVFVPMYIE